jgi:hypothetical protein
VVACPSQVKTELVLAALRGEEDSEGEGKDARAQLERFFIEESSAVEAER